MCFRPWIIAKVKYFQCKYWSLTALRLKYPYIGLHYPMHYGICANYLSNFTETAAFNVWLNERHCFSYLDVTRIDSVILVESETLQYPSNFQNFPLNTKNTKISWEQIFQICKLFPLSHLPLHQRNQTHIHQQSSWH